MMGNKRSKYNPYSFSASEGGKQVGFFVSADLYERIRFLCDTLEMSMTSLCRYLLQKGIKELEDKLEEKLRKMREEEDG